MREAELDSSYMTAEKLESPLDPLLAALANFHSSVPRRRVRCAEYHTHYDITDTYVNMTINHGEL